MKLPDFAEFEPILALRREMGATRLGHFELFDPHKHLTGEERTKLEQHGVLTQLHSLRLLQDHTLAIKNGRVVVFKLAHEQGKKQHFHVANCSVLQQCRDDKLIATTSLHSPFPVLDYHKRRSLSVCPECLTLLGYRGFSLVRNRRIRYSEQLLKQFQLTDFFKLYTLYPVR
ncbi:hypothetical protein SAMN02745127_02290 [Oceanospirillum multiglobuliferum]|uniref:Uncharacterized protein n=1 Tax=Oceanospirillum multiglobuliferum TaxID=64969 RepID=A0A1T4RBY5_9GAMM|nr:hypothetical protein [Oceanospirillum multiglobuliferum]OPX55177.1 hypothetical protein BTE48_10495 [Oceanospirillum multiglobuliferum]SKA13475.1 hypothetical protein SAMN02745127_02290 [Oceanospirillum multiglobuliferum]